MEGKGHQNALLAPRPVDPDPSPKTPMNHVIAARAGNQPVASPRPLRSHLGVFEGGAGGNPAQTRDKKFPLARIQSPYLPAAASIACTILLYPVHRQILPSRAFFIS
jgi:hypothetical protein